MSLQITSRLTMHASQVFKELLFVNFKHLDFIRFSLYRELAVAITYDCFTAKKVALFENVHYMIMFTHFN